jgi:hypothetical protein
MLSDPDGGGTDPHLLKPMDIVHGGTESHFVRSGWWRHRSSDQGIERMVAQNRILSDPDCGGTDPQILKPRDIVHGGTESHAVRSGWWRHRSSDPHTEEYKT